MTRTLYEILGRDGYSLGAYYGETPEAAITACRAEWAGDPGPDLVARPVQVSPTGYPAAAQELSVMREYLLALKLDALAGDVPSAVNAANADEVIRLCIKAAEAAGASHDAHLSRLKEITGHLRALGGYPEDHPEEYDALQAARASCKAAADAQAAATRAVDWIEWERRPSSE